MSRSKTFPRLHGVAMLFVLVGCAMAKRTLLQVNNPNPLCNVYTVGKDIVGGDLPGSGAITGNDAECKALCEATVGCDASVRHTTGACYIKGASPDVVAASKPGYTSYLICAGSIPEPVPAPPGPSPPSTNPLCNVFAKDVDIAGGDLPGSGKMTVDNAACLAHCKTVVGCKASVRHVSGPCYIKGASPDVKAVKKPGFDSYLICDSGAPVPVPVPVPPPASTNPLCDKYTVSNDIPGANLPGSGAKTNTMDACKALCDTTATCNAAVLAGGNCYMKKVNINTIKAVDVAGMVSYLNCGGVFVGFPPVPKPADATLPAGGYAAFFQKDANICPATTPKLPAACHGSFGVPADALPYYQANGGLNANGQVILDYKPIKNGDNFCYQPNSGASPILMGGQVVLKKNSVCQQWPTKANGQPCCKLYFWHPSQNGYYINKCTMSIEPDSNGVFYFRTEVPGDESKVGWGPDPDPHFHFDLRCHNGCAANSAVGTGRAKEYFCNKYYVREAWVAGGAEIAGHLSKPYNLLPQGEETFKYLMVVDV